MSSLPPYSDEIPPLVSCARCGQPDCDGDCTPTSEAGGSDTRLPWEVSGRRGSSALLSTARLVTLEPERACVSVGAGPLLPALSFAVIAELLAAGSLALLTSVVVMLILPEWSRAELITPRGMVVVAVCAAMFALLLIVLHVVFGVALERCLTRLQYPRQMRRTLRLSLYSCGWDLWSSPIGWGAAWGSGGFSHMVSLLRQAQIAPRRSINHYLERGRGVIGTAKRRVLLRSLMVTAPAVLGGSLAWLATTLWLLWRL